MVTTQNALKKLWKDCFSVTEQQEIIKPNGATGFEEVVTLTNQPCKLSFSSLQTTDQNDTTAKIVQTAKLFCDNTITIRAGSKIIVERQGKIFEFAQSGESGLFSSHQEIMLAPFRGWA